jgi:hypothetical protein
MNNWQTNKSRNRAARTYEEFNKLKEHCQDQDTLGSHASPKLLSYTTF